MEDALEYEDSIVDYHTGEVVDSYTVTVRRKPNEDRIEALKETFKFLDLNL